MMTLARFKRTVLAYAEMGNSIFLTSEEGLQILAEIEKLEAGVAEVEAQVRAADRWDGLLKMRAASRGGRLP